MPGTDSEIPLPQAARAAGLSYGQALRLVFIGEFAARKEGRLWMVRRESLDRLLEREGRQPYSGAADLLPAA